MAVTSFSCSPPEGANPLDRRSDGVHGQSLGRAPLAGIDGTSAPPPTFSSTLLSLNSLLAAVVCPDGFFHEIGAVRRNRSGLHSRRDRLQVTGRQPPFHWPARRGVGGPWRSTRRRKERRHVLGRERAVRVQLVNDHSMGPGSVWGLHSVRRQSVDIRRGVGGHRGQPPAALQRERSFLPRAPANSLCLRDSLCGAPGRKKGHADPGVSPDP